MRRWIGVLSCCLSLSLAEAQPKTTKPPKALKTAPLTALEATCHAWGDLTYALAVERDKGTSFVLVLSQMRGIFIRMGAGEAEIRLGTELAYGVYAQPKVTPAQSRQAFEIGCLAPDTLVNPKAQ